ncbi:ABC transporter substrate-binding protein [Oligoflexus tunisiensis]|uniref:ABC transporter substrate-binding protein n=1 Tax=Oligoflexus tunisiensis TaxID=708132 RepID=UPI00114CF6AA|nr:ABC transporter substrate-binding protein [Oligoflexus tunisiensis]
MSHQRKTASSASRLYTLVPAFWLLTLAFLSTLVSCKSCESTETVRIGVTPWPPFEFLFLAQEKGFFEKRGLQVKIEEYPTVEDTRRAFEKGQIDIMGMTPSDIILIRQNSEKRAQAFAVIDFSNGADVVIARSEIRHLKDLKDKKLGAEITTVSAYLLLKALEAGNLSLGDVSIESLNQAHMVKALKLGKIQAASTHPPYSVELLASREFHVIFSSDQIPGEIIDLLVASADSIERRHADYAKVLLGFFEAISYAEKNPEEAYAFMAARENLEPQTFQRSFDNVVMVGLDEQQDFLGPQGKIEVLIEQVAYTMAKLGHLDQPFLAAETWTDKVARSASEQLKTSGEIDEN